MSARAAEYGNDRIIMGAHYAMDVLGGRTLALHDVAHLLANDPRYVGQALKNPAAVNEMGQQPVETLSIADYQAALQAARTDLREFLEKGCGGKIETCAASDTSRFRDSAANEAFYAATQTYGLPVVHEHTAGRVEDVSKVAPEAGYLLTAAFPSLSLNEANDILTATLGPGGGFLNDGSTFGVYSRLNQYTAAGKAASMAAQKCKVAGRP